MMENFEQNLELICVALLCLAQERMCDNASGFRGLCGMLTAALE